MTAEVYNLSSGYSISVTEIAQMLIAALGLAGQTRITYTGSSWPGDAQRWEVSIDKVRRLGYTPAEDLESGLMKTIQWYQTQPSEILNFGTSQTCCETRPKQAP